MSFGEKIKKKREELGMTQEELSFQIHEELSRQSISKWERGEAFPDVENLLALAKTLGMHLDEMFADEMAEMGKPAVAVVCPEDVEISVRNEFPVICRTRNGGTVKIESVSVEHRNTEIFHKYTIRFKGEVLEEPDEAFLDILQYKLLDENDIVIDKSECDTEYIQKGEVFLISKIHFLHNDLGNTCKIAFKRFNNNNQ